ncbi:diphthine synthase [Pyrofollis japonicus]|uniref:diphthine synthase n=1 Tax=Pyrofollis japonicus TaxID=3060460 RepID=UPI00295C2F20|nr:diphthine synthase [Pyrofollis japonicus]BEP18222.1 diphthine synthase [Pyrofollis japonicus]
MSEFLKKLLNTILMAVSMPLYLVGAGPSRQYLTLKALELIKAADKIYIDTYTSIAPGLSRQTVSELSSRAEVVEAPRRLLEDEAHKIIEEAKNKNIVVIVPGDPLFATTHVSLLVEALRRGIHAEAIPGVSGIQAVIDATGLQFYKFCRPITLVYPEQGYKPFSVVETIWQNMERNLHSLILLDLRLDEGKAMTIPEAVNILLRLEEEFASMERKQTRLSDALMVGVARAGLSDSKCIAGKPARLLEEEFPPPPHTLIVPAPRLHPMESNALGVLCDCKECI